MNASSFLSRNVFPVLTRRFGHNPSQIALLTLLMMTLLGARAVYATTYVVTDTSDSATDTGSLRYAVNNAANGDSINFALSIEGSTIYLSGSTLDISNNVTISGPGANHLTISGANGWAVFTIEQNATVNISGLTISEGGALYGPPPGAGIVNAGGTLTLNSMTFSGNWSGLYNGATSSNTGGVLIVNNCTFSGNNANVQVDVGGVGAGMNVEGGTVTVMNSTFSNNSADQGAGMIIDGGMVTIYDSTISGNSATSVGPPCENCSIAGGGIYASSPNMVTLINSIVAGNTTNGVPGGDCDGCGTQSTYNLIGAVPNLGPLLLNGGPVQTMLPLPGSSAIQAGNPAQLPAGLTTDERGFPRLTGGKLDLGAAQTNYTKIQFVQQPTNAVVNATIAPPVTVELLETNTNLSGPNNTDPVYGVPITLTFNGTGTLGGTLTKITTSGGASFGNLSVNAPGTDDTLATSLTVTPVGAATPLILTATSDPFNIVSGVLQPQAITFTPPTSVTYGTTPIVLSATATSGLPVTFQVDSGPGTLSGDTLTFTGVGTIVVEADQAGNSSYQPAPPVVANITVQPANAGSFSLSANPSSLVLGQGQTGISTFTVTPQNNYSGTVSLSCSGLPANTTCIFTPSTVTLAGNGKAMTSQLSVTTHSSTANLIKSGAMGMAAAAILWLPGMLLGGFLGLARKKLRSKMRHVLLLPLMVAGMLSVTSGLTGCGGSGSSRTPSVPVGSYTVTITAAASSLMQSTPFTLTITD